MLLPHRGNQSAMRRMWLPTTRHLHSRRHCNLQFCLIGLNLADWLKPVLKATAVLPREAEDTRARHVPHAIALRPQIVARWIMGRCIQLNHHTATGEEEWKIAPELSAMVCEHQLGVRELRGLLAKGCRVLPCWNQSAFASSYATS